VQGAVIGQTLTDQSEGRHADQAGPICPTIPFPKDEIDQSILDRFGRVVRLLPSRIAVRSRCASLTFSALDSASDRLARHIRSRLDDGEQTVVLLQKEASRALIAILGILKAGKICVPLDPSYPSSRLSLILEDSQAHLIVADEQSLPLAGRLAQGPIAVLNMQAAPDDSREGDPAEAISPDAMAFLLYTSGSTGRPKGVIHTHRNILHNTKILTDAFLFSPDDCVSQFHSLSFVSGIAESLCALLNGASLAPYRVSEDGFGGLVDWFTAESITVLNWIPTHLRHFLSSLSGGERFPLVRLIALGSESVTRRDVEGVRARFADHCVLFNRVGSTESLIYRYCLLDRAARFEDGVPAGYAVADKEVLLLGESGEQVGFDRVGEIAVRSRYLSPGYWRRPELTRAAFADDPAGGGVRIYRTGDLGLLRRDGCLIYHGRKDFQVKIRGHRIELGEIEAILLEREDIKEAVVVAIEDRLDDKRLVAYVVPARGPGPTGAQLRAHLEGKLPRLMIPSAFVTLIALPLTPGGKVDRVALADPDPAAIDREAAYIAPRDGLERRLVEIWEEIFLTKPIGTRDNFFRLGGHSLLAARLFARMEATLGARLSLASLLRSPTIEQLAALVRGEETSASTSTVVPIQSGGATPPFFCVPGAASDESVLFAPGEWLASLARHLGPDQKFSTFYLERPAGADPALITIDAIATRLLQDVIQEQARGPYYLGGYSFGGLVALEMARQLLVRGESIGALVLFDTGGPGFPRRRSGTERLVARLSLLRRHPGTYAMKLLITLAARLRAAAVPVRRGSLPDVFSPTGAGTDGQAAAGLINVFQHARDAYFSLQHRYPGRLTLFRVTDHPDFSDRSYADPHNGWDAVAEGGVEVVSIRSEHLTMFTEPALSQVAGALRTCLLRPSPAMPVVQGRHG